MVLAGLALAGGLLYPPTNYTGLTYRVGRVLQWLGEGQWHWIYTGDYRMNNRACGIEWLSAPILLFMRSDRALFLLNFVPFLLLPGLIYGVFTQLGIARRVAWSWMWLLPTGYSSLLQAASIANDTFPAVYALAAVYFGIRARQTRGFSDLAVSTLSVALLTGAKASNLPLVLPWLVVVMPLVPMLRGRLGGGVIVLALAALVSFLPTAIFNIVYCGDWSGLVLERQGMDMKNPLVGVWGNLLLFACHNLLPPFFLFAGWWNRSILSLLPGFMRDPLVGNFEDGFHMVWELQHEDWSGLGFGVTTLLLASTVWAFFKRRGGAGWWECSAVPRGALPASSRWAVFAAAWIALLVFCVKSGMVTGARLISPYYFLLAPLFLVHAGHCFVVRQRLWALQCINRHGSGRRCGYCDASSTSFPRPDNFWCMRGPLARQPTHGTSSVYLRRLSEAVGPRAGNTPFSAFK